MINNTINPRKSISDWFCQVECVPGLQYQGTNPNRLTTQPVSWVVLHQHHLFSISFVFLDKNIFYIYFVMLYLFTFWSRNIFCLEKSWSPKSNLYCNHSLVYIAHSGEYSSLTSSSKPLLVLPLLL